MPCALGLNVRVLALVSVVTPQVGLVALEYIGGLAAPEFKPFSEKSDLFIPYLVHIVIFWATYIIMPSTDSLSDPKEYQKIFHWAETQKDGAIPSFNTRRNDPYEVSPSQSQSLYNCTNT
jgi:hypothetical protein